MSPRVKKILIWVLYPAFYLFCLILFTFWTFPYDRLKERIEAEFNSRQAPPDPVRLEIGELSSYWLSGLEAENVRLVSAPKAEPESEAGEDPEAGDEGGEGGEGDGDEKQEKKKAAPAERVIEIPHVHARVSLLRLLVGTVHIEFGADAFGGEVSGFTSDAGDARTVHIDAEDVNPGDIPMLTSAVGLPMTGALSGNVELRLPEGKMAKAEGKIELRASDLTVGDGKAKIRDTIALPKLNAGELELVAECTEGRLDIDTFTVKGSDVELVADGKLRLRDPFDASLAEMSLRFKFTDTYKNKNDMTRGLFGAPGSTVPGVFDLDTKNRRAKRPDGFYGWRLTGPMAHLNFEPSALASGSAAGSPSPVRGFMPPRR